MKSSHLFFVSAAVTAILGGGWIADANRPVAPAAIQPRMTLELGECVVSAEMKDLGSDIELCFRASNPGDAPCPAEFNYALSRSSPTSPFSRMMVMPKQVKQDTVCATAQPGETELCIVRIAKPDSASGMTQAPAAVLPGGMTPGSWRLTAWVPAEQDAGQDNGQGQPKGVTVLLATLQDPVAAATVQLLPTQVAPQVL